MRTPDFEETPDFEASLQAVREAVVAARQVASVDACVWTAVQAAVDCEYGFPSASARLLANAAVRGMADAAPNVPQ